MDGVVDELGLITMETHKIVAIAIYFIVLTNEPMAVDPWPNKIYRISPIIVCAHFWAKFEKKKLIMKNDKNFTIFNHTIISTNESYYWTMRIS